MTTPLQQMATHTYITHIVIALLSACICFHHPCMTMQKDKEIPTLQSLAFKVAIQQITDTRTNNQHLSTKLKKINEIIDKFKLSKEFIENNSDICDIADKAAYTYYCNNMRAQPHLLSSQSLKQFSPLQEIIRHNINGYSLRAEHQKLPQLHIASTPVYAVCLLNNGIIYAPAQGIFDTICPISLMPFQQFLAPAEKNTNNLVIQTQQKRLSLLKNKLSNSSENTRFTLEYSVNTKAIPNGCVFAPMNLSFINNTSATYSHDRQQIAFIDGTLIGIQQVNNILQQLPLVWNIAVPPLSLSPKKICFSRDDTMLFTCNDKALYRYHFATNTENQILISDIIALYPTNNQDVLIIKKSIATSRVEFKLIDAQLKKTSCNAFTFQDSEVLNITDACFSSDGKQIAIGFSDGKITIFNHTDYKETTHMYMFLERDKPITKVMFSSDDTILVGVSEYTRVALWHLPSRCLVHKFCLHVTHTITTYPNYQEEELINYTLPIILLNLPLDMHHSTIQEFCREHSSEVWQKPINPFELIFAQILQSCTHHHQVIQLSNDLKAIPLSPEERQRYNQQIDNKANSIKADKIGLIAKIKKIVYSLKDNFLFCSQQLYALLKTHGRIVSALYIGIAIGYIVTETYNSNPCLYEQNIVIWGQAFKIRVFSST